MDRQLRHLDDVTKVEFRLRYMDIEIIMSSN